MHRIAWRISVISDDLGSQSSLLMSPASFEEFLFPRLKNGAT
jgi:hypothetical protein